MSTKAWAAIIILPILATIVGVWWVLRITSPNADSVVLIPETRTKKVAVTKASAVNPPPISPEKPDPELLRLKSENKRLREELAARMQPTSRPAMSPASRPAKKDATFDPMSQAAWMKTLARRFLVYLKDQSGDSLQIDSEKGLVTTQTYSVLETDIKKTDSLLTPTEGIIRLQKVISTRSTQYAGVEFTATQVTTIRLVPTDDGHWKCEHAEVTTKQQGGGIMDQRAPEAVLDWTDEASGLVEKWDANK